MSRPPCLCGAHAGIADQPRTRDLSIIAKVSANTFSTAGIGSTSQASQVISSVWLEWIQHDHLERLIAALTVTVLGWKVMFCCEV